MESFAFPDKIKMTKYFIPSIFMTHHFMGNCILYSCVIVRLLQKALFVSLQYYYLEALD